MHKDRAKIEATAKEQSIAYTASKWHVSRDPLEKHVRLHTSIRGKHLTLVPRGLRDGGAVPVKEKSGPPQPKRPKLGPGATLIERTQADCDWLEERIRWGQDEGEGPRELASLSGQLTSARKHLAKLTGAFSVTRKQIVDSAPWANLRSILISTLQKHPTALKDVLDAVEKFVEEES